MGLSLYAKQLALSYVVQNGTTYYAALFTTAPDDGGANYVEATGSSYARVAHSAWDDDATDTVQYRINSGSVVFPELSAPLTGIVAWGLFDAATNGNLIAFGLLYAEGDDPEPSSIDFDSGDEPEFISGNLKFGIGTNP